MAILVWVGEDIWEAVLGGYEFLGVPVQARSQRSIVADRRRHDALYSWTPRTVHHGVLQATF